MRNLTKIKVPKKYQNRVDEIFKDNEGYWLFLNNGWKWDDNGCHTIHENTQKEILECLRDTRECTCEECTGMIVI